MAGQIDARLKELGIEIPTVAKPAAAYVPGVRTGNLIFVSGQVPFVNGELTFKGKVGAEFTVEQGQECARVCALNAIAVAKDMLGGDLDKVTRVVKLGGFVNCPADFEQHPMVINGASNVVGEIFGDKGAHSRFAVGVGSLPFNVAVEVEAVFEVE
jgi:enamine deaminase RidA (YjgF/YER057c/UK114 family)